MKIAILTANVGGIDNVIPPVPQRVGNIVDWTNKSVDDASVTRDSQVTCDYHYFTEDNLPYPLPNLSSRLQGKYLKILSHRFLPTYDVYVWMDGKVELTDGKFVAGIVEKLRCCEVVVGRHRG